MTNTESERPNQLLKTDTLGRVRTPAARREQLLAEFDHSGMSGVKFAEFVGIKYQTFATWVQMRRRRAQANSAAQASATQQLRWMEAVIEQAQSPGDSHRFPLVLQLPGGVRVELQDAQQVTLAAALVRAVAQTPLSC